MMMVCRARKLLMHYQSEKHELVVDEIVMMDGDSNDDEGKVKTFETGDTDEEDRNLNRMYDASIESGEHKVGLWSLQSALPIHDFSLSVYLFDSTLSLSETIVLLGKS